MTTVVAALERIARQCGIKNPSSWVTASRDEHLEIRDDFLSETIYDILDRVDLAQPIAKQTTLTGGGGTTNSDGSENFTLPSNFYRLQRNPLAIYDQLQDRPAYPISDDGEWTHMVDLGTAGAIHYYRVKGYDGNYTVDIYDAPGTGDTFTVHYTADVWMATSGGTEGNALSAETDVLLLPRKVVEVGTVWRFRERHGSPYEDKYNEYEALIARLSNDTRNRRVIDMGQPDPDIKWQDLVPAFIPSS